MRASVVDNGERCSQDAVAGSGPWCSTLVLGVFVTARPSNTSRSAYGQ
jgi:hypothetical protein